MDGPLTSKAALLQALISRPSYGLELIDTIRIRTKGGSLRCTAQVKGGPRSISPRVGELVALEKARRLQQADTPQTLFETPVNLFVAGFIGSPAMNFVTADLVRDDGPVVTFAGLVVDWATLAVASA